MHVSGLELTNSASPGGIRNGIRLRLTDYGTARGFELDHLYIHNVRGADFKALGGSSAIQITVEGTAKASSYDGLDIHHNRIEDVDREGIYFKSTFSKRDLVGEQQDPNTFPGAWTPSTHVRIHHNTLTDLAGDGIKLDTTSGARVDHNRVDGFQLRSPSANAGVWTFNADATTIEYNEVSGGGNTHDGMSFDADGACRGTVFQYNHGHDNKGGFLLICPYSGAKTLDTVARYNISSNDGARLVQNCWGPILNTRIYNNTFRNEDSTTAGYLVQDDAGSPATTQHELVVRNNLFVSEGGGGDAFKNPTAGLLLDHNVFHGIDLARPNPGGSTADPLLRADFRLARLPGPRLRRRRRRQRRQGLLRQPGLHDGRPQHRRLPGCGLNSLLGAVLAARLGGDPAEQAARRQLHRAHQRLVARVGDRERLATREVCQRRRHQLVGVQPQPARMLSVPMPARWWNSVRTKPGHSAISRTPDPARSRAAPWVNWTTHALDAP